MSMTSGLQKAPRRVGRMCVAFREDNTISDDRNFRPIARCTPFEPVPVLIRSFRHLRWLLSDTT